jgi:hypothetical protein
VTYQLWGGAGIITGLVLAGVGVVPLGIAAAAINGIWYYVVELIFGLFVTYGTRAFALFLANSLERPVTNDELEIEVKPARLGRRRGVPVRAVQLLIKAIAVAVAVFVGAFRSQYSGVEWWRRGARPRTVFDRCGCFSQSHGRDHWVIRFHYCRLFYLSNCEMDLDIRCADHAIFCYGRWFMQRHNQRLRRDPR